MARTEQYLYWNLDPADIVIGGIYAVMTDEGLSKVAVLNQIGDMNAANPEARVLFQIRVIEGVLQSQTFLPSKYFDLWRIGYQNTIDHETREWIEEICQDLGIKVRIRKGTKYPIHLTVQDFKDLIELIPEEMDS